MIEQRHFHEELGERARLDVVVVCFADSSHPGVGRTVRGNVEFERLEITFVSLVHHIMDAMTDLENDAFSLDDFLLVVSLFGHENKFVDTGTTKSVPAFAKVLRETHLGAIISSYFAATNMAVTPTSWNFARLTTRFERKRSTMLMAIQSVSGSM